MLFAWIPCISGEEGEAMHRSGASTLKPSVLLLLLFPCSQDQEKEVAFLTEFRFHMPVDRSKESLCKAQVRRLMPHVSVEFPVVNPR